MSGAAELHSTLMHAPTSLITLPPDPQPNPHPDTVQLDHVEGACKRQAQESRSLRLAQESTFLNIIHKKFDNKNRSKNRRRKHCLRNMRRGAWRKVPDVRRSRASFHPHACPPPHSSPCHLTHNPTHTPTQYKWIM